jgi:hypothetical protein
MATVRPTIDGFVGFEGVPILLHTADEYDEDHPLVKAHPHFFSGFVHKRPGAKLPEKTAAPSKAVEKK